MKCVAIWVAVLTWASLAQVQKPVAEFPRFTIEGGRVGSDDTLLSGVKLCALPKGGACFEMPPQMKKGTNTVEYQFGFTPQSERLKLKDGGSFVFFTGTFSGGGSGTLERLALLRAQPEGTIVNLLPLVAVTNVSERRMVAWPEVSKLPVLVTADFVWGEGEGHFDPHLYQVEAYRYNEEVDRYVKALVYTTLQKYDGGDVKPVNVIGAEKKEIIRLLKGAK